MTSTQTDGVVDVRGLLFGTDRASAADALAEALHEQGSVAALTGGVRRLSGAAGQAVERQVAASVDAFLDLDLLDLAAAGWRFSSRLREAARLTRDVAGRTEIVPMVTHRVTSAHHPCVDLFVDSVRLGTLDVGLTVVFDIDGLVAVVRRAELVAVECGRCTATGTLEVERITLANRQSGLDLPGTLRLRRGVPLLSPVAHVEPPTVAVRSRPSPAGPPPSA